MKKTCQVNIDDLLNISKNLFPTFFNSPSIYSLLVLSIVTVSEYSRKHYRFTSQTKIDLALTFLPDLMNHLYEKKFISRDIYQNLREDYRIHQHELVEILRSYIYVAGGLKINKLDYQQKPESTCTIL